jgi:acetylglutamate kinase
MRLLIKLGGTLLDDPQSRARLAREITEISPGNQIVVVHGGGKQMTRFLAERGIESRFVKGLRVTTPEIIDAVTKVFAGGVNTQLVSQFRAAGARPVGLTGLDAGLVDAEVLDPELGLVGKPVRSDASLLELLTSQYYLPVVACLAGDSAGQIYNVNADQMAVACAAAFKAERLLFLTDVEGVRDGSGSTLNSLTCAQAHALIRDGVATGGMQAKLEAATHALESGVTEVLIGPGSEAAIISKILNQIQIGTRLVH